MILVGGARKNRWGRSISRFRELLIDPMKVDRLDTFSATALG